MILFVLISINIVFATDITVADINIETENENNANEINLNTNLNYNSKCSNESITNNSDNINENKFIEVEETNYFLEANQNLNFYNKDINNQVNDINVNTNSINDKIPTYIYLRQVKDYLYEICYDHVSWNLSNDFYLKLNEYISKNELNGACSSIRKDNLFGRNYDYYYNYNAEFVIKIQKSKDNFAILGISDIPINDSTVKSGEYNICYELIPYIITDGINEYGLTCSVNVVPNKDKNGTYLINPAIEKKISLYNVQIISFILSKFTNAKDAVYFIRDYVEIRQSENHDPLHFLIADKDNTFLLEFFDNKTIITDVSNKSYMTNFYLSDVVYNKDGSVITPENNNETVTPVKTNNITPYGAGLERFNIINKEFNSLKNKDDLRQLLYNLNFTKAYKSEYTPFWYSDYVSSKDNASLESSLEYLEQLRLKYQDLFKHRNRNITNLDNSTWFTRHSSIYDLNSKTLYISTQEEEGEYIFSFHIPEILNFSFNICHSDYGKNIEGYINYNLNGNISAIINNHVYKSRVVNGYFILEGTNKLIPGNYSAYFTFISDNDEYAGASKVNLTIKEKNIPTNNTTKEHLSSTNNNTSQGINMQKTGNPILVLLLILLTLPIIGLKKKR